MVYICLYTLIIISILAHMQNAKGQISKLGALRLARRDWRHHPTPLHQTIDMIVVRDIRCRPLGHSEALWCGFLGFLGAFSGCSGATSLSRITENRRNLAVSRRKQSQKQSLYPRLQSKIKISQRRTAKLLANRDAPEVGGGSPLRGSSVRRRSAGRRAGFELLSLLQPSCHVSSDTDFQMSKVEAWTCFHTPPQSSSGACSLRKLAARHVPNASVAHP